MREAGATSQLESTGKDLRSHMDWINDTGFEQG